MLRVTCPSCRANIHLVDELSGKTIRCKQCQQIFKVGTPPNPTEPSAPAIPVVHPVSVESVRRADANLEHIQSRPGIVPPRVLRPVDSAPRRTAPQQARPSRGSLVLIVGAIAGVIALLGFMVGGFLLFRYWSSTRNDLVKEGLVEEVKHAQNEGPIKQKRSVKRDEDVDIRPALQAEVAKQPAEEKPAPQVPAVLPMVEPKPQPAPAAPAVPAADPIREGRATAMSARLLDEIKKATVFVKVDQGLSGGSGSGFLMKRDGLIGYVVTNHHVIEGESQEDFGPFFRPRRIRPAAPPIVTAVFNSGTPQELSVRAEVLASDKKRDLAILQVRGIQNLPVPIDISRKPELVETTPVFLCGFPLGQLLGARGANPAITISQGAISALRRDGSGQLDHIQLDIDMNPGNSGGPVVDNQGRLVGIAVSGFSGTRINQVIPPEKLGELAAGQISSAILRRAIVFDGKAEVLGETWRFDSAYRVRSSGSGNVRLSSSLLPKARKGVAELEVEVNLVDPLRKIKAVAVRYRKSPPERMANRAANADGSWPALEGAEKLNLNFEGQIARANLELRDIKVTDRYAFQVEFQDADGQTIFTQGHTFSLDRPKPAAVQNPATNGGGQAAAAPAQPDRPPPVARKLFQQQPREFLSDLEEFDVKSGPWPVSKNGDLGDPEHKAIQVDGVRSPKGLSMHPPDLGYSSIKYRPGKQASLFKAKVALNDSTTLVFDNAVFEVWGDGKRLWRSDPIHEPKRPQEASVDVTNVDILELRVNATSSHFGLHAVWFEPRLLQKPDTPDK